MQYVPVTRLEGIHHNRTAHMDDKTHDNPPPVAEPKKKHENTHSGHRAEYVPACPRLDSEVAALHALARCGDITADAAERQINTYLLTPHAPPGIPPRWLVMPLADAPHHALLPDLGVIVHRVLARDPVPSSLSRVVEQCIPRLRHATRPLEFNDAQPVLLSLVTALLLGLYPGSSVKKPPFGTRALLFAQLHALQTGPEDQQTRFCNANADTVLLACMEYLARVLPLHMPEQNRALILADPATQGFYRRIPAICDDFRQWVAGERDDAPPPPWELIRAECASRVERVARLKRCHPPPLHSAAQGSESPHQLHAPHHNHNQPHPQQHPASLPLPRGDEARYWDAPCLPGGAPEEFRLLAVALNLNTGTLQGLQQEVSVSPLPSNLRRMQIERLSAHGVERRTSYLQSRWFMCARCLVLPHRPTPPSQSPQARLRLDTLTQRLVCAACLSPDPVAVNMVGRVLHFGRTRHFYLCPCCMSVQEYRADALEQPWGWDAAEECVHRRAQPRKAHHHHQQQTAQPHQRRREQCRVCSEHCGVHSAWRVDHLTGEMLEFCYCQRHAPRAEPARHCTNARQMARLGGCRSNY